MKYAQRGVTLMELLTVVTVVGILASISVPSYRNYVVRAQRTEAKSALMAQAGALERCFTRFNAYNDDDCPAFEELPRTLAEGRYRLQFNEEPTAGAYLLEAVPLGGQAEDVECMTLTLDQTGNRGVADGATGTVARCWSR